MKRKRGRPTGTTVPFLKSKRRFEVATWVALTLSGMPSHAAAYLVVGLLKANKPITASSIDLDDVVLAASTEHRGKIIEHARDLIHRAKLALKLMTADEYRWLADSVRHLSNLQMCVQSGDEIGAGYCIDQLASLGWGEVLTRLLARLDPALRSNLPPFEGVLRPHTRARIARLKRRRQA